jgi:hypothetical protein
MLDSRDGRKRKEKGEWGVDKEIGRHQRRMEVVMKLIDIGERVGVAI